MTVVLLLLVYLDLFIQGIELFLDGGIFNQESVTANPDGSFEVSMSYFQKVLISAELPEFDRFEAVTINYNQDTTLSGIVRDIDDTPLPGVVVTIESSGQSAITNEAGVFSIDSPITGDQRLEIDATRVAEAVTSGEKYFNKTNLFVSIGPRQNNVIEDVIYFSPIYLNDPDSDFNAGTGGIVSSIRAPGFQLNIPANNTIFPDRAIANKISISEVASNKVSVPAPDFVEPDTVYALEPSGLKFTNRVEVTLPNVNELEPNAEVVILSKTLKRDCGKLMVQRKLIHQAHLLGQSQVLVFHIFQKFLQHLLDQELVNTAILTDQVLMFLMVRFQIQFHYLVINHWGRIFLLV
jgi:Trk K+ transport system NAD-binding subunit